MCVCTRARICYVWLLGLHRLSPPQAPLSMGFFRQEYWSGLPFSPPGDLPNSGIKPSSPALLMDFLLLSHQEVHTHCSVTKSCPTLCNPMDHSTPGSSVLCCLQEFAQIHVLWVSDAIQPSHLLPPLLLPSIFPSIKVCSKEPTLHIRWLNYWSFSFSISPSSAIFRVEFL